MKQRKKKSTGKSFLKKNARQWLKSKRLRKMRLSKRRTRRTNSSQRRKRMWSTTTPSVTSHCRIQTLKLPSTGLTSMTRQWSRLCQELCKKCLVVALPTPTCSSTDSARFKSKSLSNPRFLTTGSLKGKDLTRKM